MTSIIWGGYCVIFFTQRNIDTTKTTTICTDYTYRKQARAIRLAITSAPMMYMGDEIYLFLEIDLSIPAAITNQ